MRASGRRDAPETTIAALFVNCASCREPIDGPKSASQMWDREDFARAVVDGEIKCPCGALHLIPTVIRNLAR